MAGDPVWRLGAMRYALTLAGYWVLQLPDLGLLSQMDGQRRLVAPGEALSIREPTFVIRGKVHVIEEVLGKRPPRLGILHCGMALVPILQTPIEGVVRLIAAEETDGFTVSYPQILVACEGSSKLQAALLAGLTDSLEAQHWALRLSAHAAPLSRLAVLLLEIAESRGVVEGNEILVQGVPDTREMGVLAGVSRENVVINLAWLEHQGVLRREEGRLLVADLPALRRAATPEDRPLEA
ncbi:MAG: helix-turn-helix domain-containing protein [Chloroflexota bacterium]|nr:helix-turn-helix domain-containing protein [Chloroflexota bacterium]